MFYHQDYIGNPTGNPTDAAISINGGYLLAESCMEQRETGTNSKAEKGRKWRLHRSTGKPTDAAAFVDEDIPGVTVRLE
jgi:hypothetical protein